MRARSLLGSALLVLLIASSMFYQPVGQEMDDDYRSAIEESRTYQEAEEETPARINDIDGFFTQNDGILEDPSCSFFAIGSSLSVAFGPAWVAYAVPGVDNDLTVFRMYFQGSEEVVPTARVPTGHRSNFFMGADSDTSRINVCNNKEVWYHDLYPDIDAKFYFEGGMLKYEFIVNPGGDPGDILLSYIGIDSLTGSDAFRVELPGSKAPMPVPLLIADGRLVLGIDGRTVALEPSDVPLGQ